jgi:hypothetical protein
MNAMSRWARLGRAGLVALALVSLAGCDRKPRLVPAGADSTAVAPQDSTAAVVQKVRDAWDQGAADGSAARATAALLLADLQMHRVAPLEARARGLMDSLSLGAEVDGHGDLAVVNFFSLADPAGGSWPYLFWRDSVTVRSQPVEGGGMRLGGSAARPDTSGGGVQAAAMFTRTAPAGPQPLVFVWRRAPHARQWSLAHTLGPDSLGGIGTARFAAGGDSAALQSRTWRRTPGFEECPSCSHVYVVRRFRWGPEGFSTIDSQVEDSPYVSFVRFVEAITVPDDELAHELVTDDSVFDTARGLGFAERRGAWREAPGGGEVPNEMAFFRGSKEAYKITFMRLGGRWKISHIESAGRSIE